MSLLFRPRTALCALTALILTACGGGGDSDSGLMPSESTVLAADARANSVPPDNQVYVLATTTATAAGAYDFTSGLPLLRRFGTTQMGFITLTATNGLSIEVGYLKGDKSKFAITMMLPDMSTYQCISKAWGDADKANLLSTLSLTTLPAVCDASVKLNDSNGLLSLVKSPILGGNGKKLVLNINTTLLPITFPTINLVEVHATSTTAVAGKYEFTVDTASVPQTVGTLQLAHVPLTVSGGLQINVGHIKDDKTKFFVSVVQSGVTTYDCLSAAWSEADKNELKTVGTAPETCDSGVVFNGTTNTFSLTQAELKSAAAGTPKIVLTVAPTPLNITFP